MAGTNNATTGMSLLWAALVLDGVGILLTWHRISPGLALLHLPALAVVGFLVLGFITAEVAAGHTWARVVYLAFTIVGVLMFIGFSRIPAWVNNIFYRGVIGNVLSVLMLVLQVIGVVLLFTAPSIRR